MRKLCSDALSELNNLAPGRDTFQVVIEIGEGNQSRTLQGFNLFLQLQDHLSDFVRVFHIIMPGHKPLVEESRDGWLFFHAENGAKAGPVTIGRNCQKLLEAGPKTNIIFILTRANHPLDFAFFNRNQKLGEGFESFHLLHLTQISSIDDTATFGLVGGHHPDRELSRLNG